MTPVVFALLALAGGIGASTRLLFDGAIRARMPKTLPWGTILVNLTGSLALGLLTGLAAGHLISQELYLVIGAGFLGGYTTFSTASFETVRLLQERRWMLGTVNGLGSLIAATAAAGLGLWVATLM